MAKVTNVGTGFSTLPFDGIDNVANVFLHDDFIAATQVADIGADTVYHSELTWNADETVVNTGPGTIAVLSGEAGHPGIIALQTDDEADAVMTLALGGALAAEADGPILLDSNGVYCAAMIRIPDIDGAKVEFALVGQAAAAVNSSVADLVGFVWDSDDAANVGDQLFLAQVNSATVDTEEAFSLPYVEGDWVLLEMFATSTDAYFRMTTEDGVETIHLAPDAMPLVGLRPIISVQSEGANVDQVDIDAFHLRYRRPEKAANAGISWLGA